MPIYEYRCNDCEHEFEIIQKISDPVLVDCPKCGMPSLKKKVSAAAFRLKGGGWYETDFKSGDKKKNIAGESNTNSSGASQSGSDKGVGKAKSENKSADAGASVSAEKKA